MLVQNFNIRITSTTIIENYFKEVFYEISNIKKEDYKFYISKVQFIYYQGNYSLLIKFCDESALNFFYFSFDQH